MNSPLTMLLAGSEWSLVLGLALKATLLLTVGAAFASFRRSAAERHLAWTLTLAASLLLAVLTPLAPRLAVPVGHAQGPFVMQVSDAPMGAGLGAPATTSGPNEHDIAAKGHAPRTSPWRMATTTAGTLAMIWFFGCIAVLLWCLLGHLGLARLARGLSPLEDGEWRTLLRTSSAGQGLARRVRLGRSGAVGAPVTWGWLRPIIVVPAEAESWPSGRRQVAVAHEVAHVARHDYLVQLMASVALAVYWFHPLAWLAVQRLRIESEHACDDRVLAGGAAAPDYATHLVEVARRARRLRIGGMVAVSMARTSHLGRRILAVLDDSRARRVVSGRTWVVPAVVVGLVLVPYAGLRPVLGAPAPQQEEARASVAPLPKADEAPQVAVSGSDDDAVSSRVDRMVPAKSGEELFLDLETGGSVVIRAWDQPRVHVRAALAGTNWRETRVDVERVSGGVRVRSTVEPRIQHGNTSTSHSFEIQVPRRFDVRIRSAGGGLSITGVAGDLRGNTGGGELVLDHVHGRARLSTGGGEIEVTDSDLSGSVSTGGGTVRLSRVRGGLRGWSGSGPVIEAEGVQGEENDETGAPKGVAVHESPVRVDQPKRDARGALHIEKAGGDVELEDAPRGGWISTGGGDIHVGPAGGPIEANTGGGDNEIGPVASPVTAVTGAGNVHITAADARGGDRSVEVTSGTGRVVVDLPSDFDGSFELETAYTRSSAPTHIDSAWPLERESTTAWSDREGTPRRYVRAHGAVGRGTSVVRIKTVNGDIVVRRANRAP